MTNTFYLLKFGPLHGTVQHYYHFFYGVLIPLIIEYIELNKQKKNPTFLIEDGLGPMIRLLSDLPLDFKFIFKNDSLDLYTPYEKLYIRPMDIHPSGEDKRDAKWLNIGWAQLCTHDVKKDIQKWFNNNIKIHDLFVKPFPKYDIVIIERKTNIAFKSMKFEKNTTLSNRFKTSGSDRRSIINHNELVNSIIKYFPKLKCISISLDHLPLFEQYILFNNAKFVIAQHGAAISNIIFMKDKTILIEIISNVLLNSKENWFNPVAKMSKIIHHQYITSNEKVKVYKDPDNIKIDLKDFTKFLDNVL